MKLPESSRKVPIAAQNSVQLITPDFVIMRVLRSKTKSTRSSTINKSKHPEAAPNTSAHSHDDLFARGIALFNSKHFFEAHEAWEEIWLHTRPPEKTFFQGLIQVTAAFHHHSRRNLRGTKSLLRSGLAKLQPFPAKHRNLHLDELRATVQQWIEALDQENAGHLPALPSIVAAPRFR